MAERAQTFQTMALPARADATAPDGSDVRVLLSVAGGSVAHFELGPGHTSIAVEHRTVEEVWYFVRGRGQFWRSSDEREEIVEVSTGVCVTIPLGTRFQFRTGGDEPLAAVATTIPAWPGDDEAMPVEGPWQPTVRRGAVER